MKIKTFDIRKIPPNIIIVILLILATLLIFNLFRKHIADDSDIRFIRSVIDAILPFDIEFEEEYVEAEQEQEDVLSLRDVININSTEYEQEPFIPTFANVSTLRTMEDLIANLYSIEYNAYVTFEDLDVDRLTAVDLSIDLFGNEPKVLIFHTHSQEDFIDSRDGVVEDTIIGVGQRLAEILTTEYNISVVHDVGQYDVVNGSVSRGGSYERMEPAIRRILEKYPSIEIVIDLHRDGVPDDVHFITEINGKPTARIMYFNGITRLNQDGELRSTGLVNPYLEENLALSLQMQLMSNELYPSFTRKIYIKPYRYSLHMKPRSLLVEVGANTNTIEEAKNAMEPLAEVLVRVLNG